MRVSIITPTFNKCDCLEHTLAALEQQQFPRDDFEVIVVDDGSTDQTRTWLTNHKYRLPLRPVFHEQNQGRAAARNTGLKAAQGGIILFLDDDMEVTPDWIQAHLAYHDQDRNAVVQGNSVTSPKLKQSQFTRYLDHTGVHRLAPGSDIPFKYFATNNSSVRRETLDRVGHFDPAFREYGGEDVELGYRLKNAPGITLYYAPGARAFHLHLKNLTATCQQLERYGETSLYHIYTRYPDLRVGLNLHILDAGDPKKGNPASWWKKLVYRLGYHWPIKIAARAVAILPLGRLVFPVFDFLLSYSYLKGLKKRIGQEKRSPAG
jgi:glycosyltransferase involved in cell wall biosynthesis